MSVDEFLHRLAHVRKNGSGWVARCPGHQDERASLSVAAGDDGRVLVHCHAGCTFGEIVTALGLESSDLMPERYATGGGRRFPRGTRATVQRSEADPRGCTLEAYTEAKRLPLSFLGTLGISEFMLAGAPALRIPYESEGGVELAVRFRTAREGDGRFRWKSGAKPHLYGLSRLRDAREAGYILLLEGESDVQTAWYHKRPAVGLPGANVWREERDAAALSDIPTVYIPLEPDAGGDAILRWLHQSAIRERARLVSLEDFKDLNELHLRTSEQEFQERLEAALLAATPWGEHERVLRKRRTAAAWVECEQLAREPRLLDRLADELARSGLAGERQAAQLLYLALTSRLLECGQGVRPVSVALKGPSSVGKSHLVERVLEFMPEAAYYALTGMSERALAYGTEPLAHRFIVLNETEGLQEGFAAYLVRSLLSEGRLRYELVEKTSQGLQPRLIEREGPTGLVVTTTSVALHAENETRLLSLFVSDTREQTKNVLRALVSDYEPPDVKAWHALQHWLEGGERRVQIPYAAGLAEAIPPIAVRLRRDFAAVLNLIRAHALLHRTTRERDEQVRIVATLDDYEVVRGLVAQLVAEGVEATVPATVRETVLAVDDLNASHDVGLSVSRLAQHLDLDKSAASRRCRRAARLGYIKNLETSLESRHGTSSTSRSQTT